MVYVALNTMIWLVVRLSGERITPANWESQEVYTWGMRPGDVPAWYLALRRKLRRTSNIVDDRKDGIELADTDSTINNGSTRFGVCESKASDRHSHVPRGAPTEMNRR